MKPSLVFVQREIEDKLGPMSVASYLKDGGYPSSIVINPQKNIKTLAEMKPDFIGLSVFAPTAEWAVNTAGELKRQLPGTRIVFGGPHPTFFPDIVEHPDVDIVCQGEGETPALEMLRRYRNLWCDLSWRTDHAPAGKLNPEWRPVFLEMPDRFMVGTDTPSPEYWERIVEHARLARSWLAELPRDVAEKIAWRNGETI